MSWQDCLFGFGGFFFAASLLPTIRSKHAEVPLRTSLPTAALLASYVVAEWTIHLHLAAIAGVFSSAAWFLVALMRRPPSRKSFAGRMREARKVVGTNDIKKISEWLADHR